MTSPTLQKPVVPVDQPSKIEVGVSMNHESRLAEIIKRNQAWNSMKVGIATWAAQNEGQSTVIDGVEVSSSKTSLNQGKQAPPAFHYVTLKSGDNSIELLVHDISGDINRQAGCLVNGALVDFDSRGFSSLQQMLPNMNRVDSNQPAKGESDVYSDKPIENNKQAEYDSYRRKVIQNIENPDFSLLVTSKDSRSLASIANNVKVDSPQAEKTLFVALTSFATTLATSPRFNHDGRSSYNRLGNVTEILQGFDTLPPAEREQSLLKWLDAINEYVFIDQNNHFMVRDDNGRQYVILEDGTVQFVGADNLKVMTLPRRNQDRFVSFLGLKALLGGEYSRGVLQWELTNEN
jgi:hypothetical protein